jgi:ligand-binding sensor domain-containing protein
LWVIFGETLKKNKKMNMYNSDTIKACYFTLILSFIFNLCVGQISEPIPVKSIKIHKDSISVKEETQAESRNSRHDKDYPENQISAVVRTVFQDSKGHFWFGTQNGLCRYDKTGLVYFVLKASNGQTVTVHVIIEDKIGNIWIGYDSGIAKFDGNYFTMYYEKDTRNIGGLWSMTMDKKGMLWIGTTRGVYTFDSEKFSPFEIPEGKKNPDFGVSTSKMIHSIIEDSKGKMWFATNGGVYIYDGNTLKNISEKEGLKTNFVGQIIESKDGSFYISTSKGLFKYDGNTVINITEKLLNPNEGVRCILEDKNGTLWFTTNKRDIYTYKNKVFTKIESIVDEFNLFPFTIYQDNQDRLWFVGLKGAFRLENDTFINVYKNGPW